MANSDFTFVMDEGQYNVLKRNLDKLSKVDKAAAIKKPLREGADTIAREGKTNLTQRNNKVTGNLRRSIGVKVDAHKAAAYAGFKRSSKYNKIGGGNHSYLVDRGTTYRWTKYKHPVYGTYRGSVSKDMPNSGSLFWTDAVQTNGGNVMEHLCEAIYDEMTRIMNRN